MICRRSSLLTGDGKSGKSVRAHDGESYTAAAKVYLSVSSERFGVGHQRSLQSPVQKAKAHQHLVHRQDRTGIARVSYSQQVIERRNSPDDLQLFMISEKRLRPVWGECRLGVRECRSLWSSKPLLSDVKYWAAVMDFLENSNNETRAKGY
jgi:hypothetical protein